LPAIIHRDGSQKWFKHGVKYAYPSLLYTNTNHRTR